MFIAALFTIANIWKQPKCPTIDEWIKKMRYTHNGILFSHKKEWSTNTCYNMDEPWKHSAKWNKPVTKNRILFESIWTGQNRQIYYSDRKQIRGCLGLGGVRGIRNNCKMRSGFLSEVMECSRLVLMMVVQLSMSTLNHWIVHLWKDEFYVMCIYLTLKIVMSKCDFYKRTSKIHIILSCLFIGWFSLSLY